MISYLLQPIKQICLFDYVIQHENKVKHLSLYQERRFTKLGYSAAAVLDAFPYIQMVLNETNLSNLHTEIVQLFLDSELLSTELLCLAYFTHKISLPLLFANEYHFTTTIQRSHKWFNGNLG